MATINRFVNDLDRVVQQAIQQRALKLVKGQCKDFNEYHREVGRSEGMQIAVDVARDMLRNMELAEDNEQLPEMQQPPKPRRSRSKR